MKIHRNKLTKFSEIEYESLEREFLIKYRGAVVKQQRFVLGIPLVRTLTRRSTVLAQGFLS
jgi:hypothetical protein